MYSTTHASFPCPFSWIPSAFIRSWQVLDKEPGPITWGQEHSIWRRVALWCSYPSSTSITEEAHRMVTRVHHGFSSCLSGTQIQMTLSKSSTSVGSTGSVHPTLIVLVALWMYTTASRPTQLDYNHFICHPANTRAPVPYSLCGCLASEWRFRLWFVCYC